MTRVIAQKELMAAFTGNVRKPTVMMWNRLEGRPRATEFSRALKAEGRDALWMLTRQWQMGEFIGEDAGSPAIAKVAWRNESVQSLSDKNRKPLAFDPTLPVEAQVEAQSIELTSEQVETNANLRVSLGRRWLKLLQANSISGLDAQFIKAYSFHAPDPASISDAAITSSAGVWQYLAAIAGRAMDGGLLLRHLQQGGQAAIGLGLVSASRSKVNTLGHQFVEWVKSRYITPDTNLDAWIAEHLEYDFGVVAPDGANTTGLRAREYHGGRLDWYHYDATTGPKVTGGKLAPLEVTSFLPTQAKFDGMPNTRHWMFEEGAVNFGDISPDTTDISKLLLIEFGLVYANDWFLLPIDVPYGSLTRIEGVVVTNVFGERTWINSAESINGPEDTWSMYKLTDKGRKDDRLYMPAVVPVGLESQPIEAVDFGRDEVSNMVWGVERVVSTADGAPRRGRNLGQEVRAWHQAQVTPSDNAVAPGNDARFTYRLMSSVPEHWIPFVPVHVPNNNREIQLQRGAMPRMLDGADTPIPEKVRPRTSLLRHQLEQKKPYFMAEEEVSRAGTIVEKRWQRVRWRDGRIVLWLGNKRFTGRGEIHSGLAFDSLDPVSGSK